MGYYIDIEKITIDAYRKKLESAYLPPSRMILKDKLDERFGYFQNLGIKNVKDNYSSTLTEILKREVELGNERIASKTNYDLSTAISNAERDKEWLILPANPFGNIGELTSKLDTNCISDKRVFKVF